MALLLPVTFLRLRHPAIQGPFCSFPMKLFPFLALLFLIPLHAGRVPWRTSGIQGLPEPPGPYKLERAFPELSFDLPVEMVWSPGLGKFALLEVDGKVFAFDDDQGASNPALMIDLKETVQAEKAYGMVFHPDFRSNRFIYLCYIIEKISSDGTKVSRFTVRDTDPPTIDPASEKMLLSWRSGGHNGCSLQFGPDGFLYISTGDGTPAAPPDGLNTGQDIGDLLSSVLRIDVDNAEEDKNYRVPADNPFVDLEGARPEVWAYGLRNPWRMSFDRESGDLWVGDVGWETKEMIYKVRSGGNYGWSVMEGSQPVKPDDIRGPTPILAPTVEHLHTEAKSITGGFVYYGNRLKDLTGNYVYGDYITGKIWSLNERENRLRELADTTIAIICFAPDAEGELYVVDYGGPIYRLVENSETTHTKPFPRKLSETGLFADITKLEPAEGVIPYAINAEAWHDHAKARRLLALPGKTKLGIYDRTEVTKGYVKGAWSFPDGAVIAKTLSLEMESGNPATERLIETQVLHRHNDQWHAVNYLWNEDGTDAMLAPDEGGDSLFEVKDPRAPGGVRLQSWRHASRTECMLCHNNRTGNIWSFNVAQLNTGKQLERLAQSNLFKHPLPRDRTSIADPYDSTFDIGDRARAYLHVNCTHCHTRGGGGTAVFQTRIEYSLAETLLVKGRPVQGDLGILDPYLIAPGDPYRSVLYHRLAKLGPGHMPQFGSRIIDEKGLALIGRWITEMPPDDLVPTPVSQAGALKNFENGNLSSIDKLLARPETALLLADAITDKDPEEEPIRSALARAADHENPFVRDLFLRFREKPVTTNRIGLSSSTAEILTLQGNADNGRSLFRRADLLCLNCHVAEGQGRNFGPDLDGIGGKFNRVQILDQILRPSNVIHPDYVLHELELKDGSRLAGFVLERSEEEILLRDPAYRIHRIPPSNVEFTSQSPLSAMPPGILQNLTVQEAADLVDYLQTLK